MGNEGRCMCTIAAESGRVGRGVGGRDSGRVFVAGIETMTPEITGRL